MTISPGIYHVRFSSSQDLGEGIVVIQNGSVNGGDYGYAYSGRFTPNNNGAVEVRLSVTQWNRGVASIFGNISAFNLSLSGSQAADRSFVLTGNVVEQPTLSMTVVGKFIANAS